MEVEVQGQRALDLLAISRHTPSALMRSATSPGRGRQPLETGRRAIEAATWPAAPKEGKCSTYLGQKPNIASYPAWAKNVDSPTSIASYSRTTNLLYQGIRRGFFSFECTKMQR